MWQPYMGKSQGLQQKGETFYSCTMTNGKVAKRGYFWQDSNERKSIQRIKLSKIKQHIYTDIIFVSAKITWEYYVRILGWWIEKYERSSQKLGLNRLFISKWLLYIGVKFKNKTKRDNFSKTFLFMNVKVKVSKRGYFWQVSTVQQEQPFPEVLTHKTIL